MKIRAAKNGPGTQQSQGVNAGNPGAEGADGTGTGLPQEFQGLLATFAGGISDTTTSISLDTFDIQPLALPDKQVIPTEIQTAVAASSLAQTQNSITQVDPDGSRREQANYEAPHEQAVDTVSEPTSNGQSSYETVSQPASEPNVDSSTAPSTALSAEEVSSGESEVTAEAASTLEGVVTQDTAPTGDGAPTSAPELREGTSLNHEAKGQKPGNLQHVATAAAQNTKVATSDTTTQALPEVTATDKSSTPTSMKDKINAAVAKVMESFEPIETAPKNAAQNAPSIPVLSQLLKQSAVSEMISGAHKHTENIIQNSNHQQIFQPFQQQTTAISGVASTGSTRNDASEARAPRPLTPSMANRTLERVDQALKEVARSKDGKSISFVLEPNELGAVKVDVTLKDGSLHARLSAESSQVSQLLRERAPELQSMLRKLGLNVDRVTVSVSSDGASFSHLQDQLEQHHAQQRQNGNSNRQGGFMGGHEVPAGVIGQGTQRQILDHWVA